MSQTIYIATAGGYDDYRVVAAFTNEGDAKNCPTADDYFPISLRDGAAQAHDMWVAGWIDTPLTREPGPVITHFGRGIPEDPDAINVRWYRDPTGFARLTVTGCDRQHVLDTAVDHRERYMDGNIRVPQHAEGER